MELHEIIRIGGRDLREAMVRRFRIVQGEEQPPPPSTHDEVRNPLRGKGGGGKW